MDYKLGKKPAFHDPRTLRLGVYLNKRTLPQIPKACHWNNGVPKWPMYGNDQLGDCTIAAIGHHAGLWTYCESGKESIIPEPAIVSAYSAVSGYVQGDQSTDNGAVMLDVLKYWRKTGVGGSTIEAFAGITPSKSDEVKAAVYLFGGCYIGLSLPATAEAQIGPDGCWKLVKGYRNNPKAQPGTLGGHCVPVVGYTSSRLTIITWGMTMTMTWGFFKYYCDEAYGPLSPQWVAKGGIAPNHIDLQSLLADVQSISSKSV